MTNSKTNVKTIIKAPFKADHVGSLLRPERLHDARKQFKEQAITAEQLHNIETEEIKRVVDKQIEIGLEVVTDGEFRRTWWHFDFLEHLNGFEGYVPERGLVFDGLETERYNVRNVGKISFNKNHPFVQDFKEFNEIVNGRAAAKQTIPSPNQLFYQNIRNREVYSDIEEYANDIIQTYRDALKAFYDAGVRYLQLDDVYIAALASEELPERISNNEFTKEYLVDLAIRVINGALEGKPKDLVVTTHLCRGNYQSTWAFEGGYDSIAPTLLGKEKVDGFFLEYDDERSGGFEPLKYVPKGGAQVILGVITSKSGALEDKEFVKSRIQEAAKYVPLEQICLSPQCGFASTHLGNKLTEDEQWAKLKFVVDISKEVWG